MAVRKRKIQANYLKIDKDTFELLGTGFTELNESPSAQTTSKRYIKSSARQSITGYEWSTSFSADQIVSEKAIEYIRNIGEMQITGAETEKEYLIVDLDKPANN